MSRALVIQALIAQALVVVPNQPLVEMLLQVVVVIPLEHDSHLVSRTMTP
jgi:hypothetical protein